jgi:hypothetical protein
MALSDVDICNLGLVYIGETAFLTSIDGDTTEDDQDSTAAEVAARIYAPTRDEVLRDVRPKWANRIWQPAAIVETTLHTTIVPDQWAYAFLYPEDCVFLRGLYPGVRNPLEEQKYEHDLHSDATVGKIILADVAAPTLQGTARIEDEGQFSSDFVEALAWKLAFKFATSIRKDPKAAQLAFSSYRAAAGTASANSNQEVHLARPSAPHISARG